MLCWAVIAGTRCRLKLLNTLILVPQLWNRSTPPNVCQCLTTLSYHSSTDGTVNMIMDQDPVLLPGSSPLERSMKTGVQCKFRAVKSSMLRVSAWLTCNVGKARTTLCKLPDHCARHISGFLSKNNGKSKRSTIATSITWPSLSRLY
jgi:hypothetical protein